MHAIFCPASDCRLKNISKVSLLYIILINKLFLHKILPKLMFSYSNNFFYSLPFQQPFPSPVRAARLSWLPFPPPWPSSCSPCCSTSWLAGLSIAYEQSCSWWSLKAMWSVCAWKLFPKWQFSSNCMNLMFHLLRSFPLMLLFHVCVEDVCVCGFSWPVLFRASTNPRLIIRLTDPLLVYKSWDYTHSHSPTHTDIYTVEDSQQHQWVQSYREMWNELWPFSVCIGRFCCHSKSKHPDEKRLHFGNGHCKYLAPSSGHVGNDLSWPLFPIHQVGIYNKVVPWQTLWNTDETIS